MRIYICGPIMGQESDEVDRYLAAEREIQKQFPGEEFINPWITCAYASMTAKLSKDDFKKIRHALIDVCDAIYLMDGWELYDECHEDWIYAKNIMMKVVKE